MPHTSKHPQAGSTVKIKASVKQLGGQEFRLEDWWDRVAGKSWMFCDGNPACLQYAMRSGFSNLPCDNEVVYGKVGSFGHLVHVSEIESGEPVSAQ